MGPWKCSMECSECGETMVKGDGSGLDPEFYHETFDKCFYCESCGHLEVKEDMGGMET